MQWNWKGLRARALACVAAVVLAACGGADEAVPASGLLKAGAVEPQIGIWWNPGESGRGFAIERQGGVLTVGAYLYEADGRPLWLVGPLARQGDGSYLGTLSRYGGGQTLGGSYRAPTTTVAAATATFVVSTPTSGTLTLATAAGSQALPVQRFALAGGTVVSSAAGFENGLWWNDAESGRGFFVDVQGATAALASYMYDASGQPVWYLTVGAVSGQGFSGELQTYQNGQALGAAYRAPQATGSAGTVAFRGLTGTTAELTLPDGRRVPLKRLVFASADPPAGASGPLEGVYEGTSTSGGSTARVQILALDNGDVWVADGTGEGSLTQVEGLTFITGAGSNGSYVSSSLMTVYQSEDAQTGSFTGTYVAGTSLSGQATVIGDSQSHPITAAVMPVARYDYSQPASLATITGSWPFRAAMGATGTMVIAADGAVSGSFATCTLSGTVSPRPGGRNVFQVIAQVSGTADLCGFSVIGVAYRTLSPAGQQQLWVGLTLPDRSDGTFVLGVR
ncbi:hypothetical protein [Ramlibacter sp.]|uniref:hypothetical protein n=1 Tax=Ramlibacter sp. TaxID=1917967 RepID=UPI0035B2F7DC